MCSVSAHYTDPRGICQNAAGSAWGDQDHRKPTRTGLTNDHLAPSVCRVQRDLEDDDWLRAERQRIGRSIKAARMDANLTQDRVYLAVPMSRNFYQEIEAGRANPSLNILLAIARAIGVPVSHLLG